MKLHITHLTKYTYQAPVVESVNEVRLSPISTNRQFCHENSLIIAPSVSLFSYKDYFGNTVHYFTIPAPHQELVIESHSIVETAQLDILPENMVTYMTEREILDSEPFKNQYAEYLMETEYTKITSELQELCMDFHTIKVESSYQLLEQISNFIYSTLTYDTAATHVNTTVEETLRLKRGVCQDFAHLMIAICRLLRIPSRYVSGYQFIGDIDNDQNEIQHASHAWVEAYIPLIGWVGFDPTNNGKIDWRYVKIGHGRNYSDIVPVKGVYQGAAAQQLDVTVDVRINRD